MRLAAPPALRVRGHVRLHGHEKVTKVGGLDRLPACRPVRRTDRLSDRWHVQIGVVQGAATVRHSCPRLGRDRLGRGRCRIRGYHARARARVRGLGGKIMQCAWVRPHTPVTEEELESTPSVSWEAVSAAPMPPPP